MIRRGVEIVIALDPIDMRWGCDRLCGVVTERLGRSARAQHGDDELGEPVTPDQADAR